MSKVIYLNEDHDDLMIGGSSTSRVETEQVTHVLADPVETNAPDTYEVPNVHSPPVVVPSPEMVAPNEIPSTPEKVASPPLEYSTSMSVVQGGAEARIDVDSDDDDSAYDDDNLDSASSVSSVLTENLLKLDPLYIRLTKFLQHEDQNITEVLFGIQNELKTLNLNLQAHLQR